MSENTNVPKERLLKEAELYPDQRSNTETRRMVLEPIYEYVAQVDKIDNPRAIVLGAGKGADILSIKKVNPDTEFIAAVDAYPPTQPHIIKDETGEPLVSTTKQEIVTYLDDPKNKADIDKANLFAGTRLGPSTIAYSIRHLPEGTTYMGIFTSDQQDVSNEIMNAIEDKDLDYKRIKGPIEDIYLVTPKSEKNPYTQLVNEAENLFA